MSGFVLKVIAIICMTIDHLFKLAPKFIGTLPNFSIPLPGFKISLLGIILLLGRISFPLFAFGVAQGCIHTKNFTKYLKRLFIFALISELPFDFMFYGGFTMAKQNVIWTFFFGVFAVYLYEKLKPSNLLGLFAVLITMVVCYLCRTDYNSIGVILIFAIYAIKNKPLKLTSVVAVILIYYLWQRGLMEQIMAKNTSAVIQTSLYLSATLLSVPIMAAYNGKKGFGMKWFFYTYYPLHLILLGAIDKLWF